MKVFGKIFVLLLVTPLVTSFTPKEDKYFEGIVVYKKTYELIHPNATQEFIQNNYGTKQILIYKNGNSKRIDLNKDSDTINLFVHSAKNKRAYGTFDISSDTLLTYSTLNNDLKDYKIQKIDNQNVNGQDLEGYGLELYVSSEFSTGKGDTIKSKNYYSKSYKLNPKFHEYIYDGFNNEIIEKYPYLVLKSIRDDGFIKIETKEMIEIHEMDIDNSEFNIKETKILKEI